MAEVNVEWDAVTRDAAGNPLREDTLEELRYEVWYGRMSRGTDMRPPSNYTQSQDGLVTPSATLELDSGRWYSSVIAYHVNSAGVQYEGEFSRELLHDIPLPPDTSEPAIPTNYREV